MNPAAETKHKVQKKISWSHSLRARKRSKSQNNSGVDMSVGNLVPGPPGRRASFEIPHELLQDLTFFFQGFAY